MLNVKQAVEEIIIVWNNQIKKSYEQTSDPKLNIEFEIKVGVRKKKYYINRKDFYENKVAEIILYHKGLEKIQPDVLICRA